MLKNDRDFQNKTAKTNKIYLRDHVFLVKWKINVNEDVSGLIVLDKLKHYPFKLYFIVN